MDNILPNHKQKLSIRAKEIRKNDGKSVREFAELHNVSKSQISKFETGYYDKKVSPAVAKSFCKIYNIKYDEFIANYDYGDNHKVIVNLGTKAQIETRLSKEFSNKHSGEVCKAFFEKNKNKHGLSKNKNLNYLKQLDLSYNDIYIEKDFECMNKNNEKIYITYFLRPFLFPNKPRSENYRYIGKAISDVFCYDKSELGDCKNFIFITPSMDVYNFYTSKKYNNSPNNLYIVLVGDEFTFTEPRLLFGKEFL